MSEAARRKAEDLMFAMARESWNDSVSRLEAIISACTNLGAELAMLTNNMSGRQSDRALAAFRDLETALSPDEQFVPANSLLILP